MKNSITVIIPTYGRPNHIDDILFRQIKNYQGDLFRFVIYDSSTERDSLSKYEAFDKEIHNNIIIEYNYCPAIASLSSKVEYAISTIDTTYFYLLGDGLDINYNGLEEELLRINFSMFDVLNVNSYVGHYCKTKQCENRIHNYLSDSKSFVIENMSLMTLYGASIVKTDLMKSTIECGYYKRFFELNDGQNGFVYVTSLCERILELNNLQLISFSSKSIKGNNIIKPLSNKWSVGSSLYEVGFKRFLNSIDGMRNLSENEKKIIIHRYYFEDWSAYSICNLMNYKIEKSITDDLLIMYRCYLLRTGLYNRFVCVNYIPCWPFKICNHTFNMIKRIIKEILNKNGSKK